MRNSLQYKKTPWALLITLCLALTVSISNLFYSGVSAADTAQAHDGRLVTIHDRDSEKVILTHASTIREALADGQVNLDEHDTVEPGLDEKMVATDYTVNIYRARPIIVVDGMLRQKIMTPYQTPEKIAKDAGLTLHDEDKTKLLPTDDIVTDGAGLQLVIDRATEFTLDLYGTKTTAYTQQKTVGDMLRSKNIVLGANDTVSVDKSAAMQSGMTVEIWRNGVQTVTEQQDIPFPTQQIQDADQPVGYKQVQTPGVVGKKTVSYEVEMKNGKEVSRKEIQSVVNTQPKQQVEVVGAKPSFSGDFAAALAKLRSCEGGYTSVNPAGYYGAYQFTQSAWNSNAPAGYSGINPTTAPPSVQDQAARNYYVKSGWRPWPNCGKGLPDIYR